MVQLHPDVRLAGNQIDLHGRLAHALLRPAQWWRKLYLARSGLNNSHTPKLPQRLLLAVVHSIIPTYYDR